LIVTGLRRQGKWPTAAGQPTVLEMEEGERGEKGALTGFRSGILGQGSIQIVIDMHSIFEDFIGRHGFRLRESWLGRHPVPAIHAIQGMEQRLSAGSALDHHANLLFCSRQGVGGSLR
jgi:hypothetical protein